MNARHEKYQRLIDYCKTLPPTPTAVVHPCDRSSLEGAVEAAKLGLIAPILVGPRAQDRGRREGRRRRHLGASARRCAAQPCRGGSRRAARARRQGRGADEGQPAHRRADGAPSSGARRGLRTARRISHCFVMDVPSYEHALIITDAAVNIAPTLEEKVDILQNAIDLAHALQRRGGARRDPLGDGDRQSEGAFDGRGGGAVQDGRSRPDHRRARRRPARARQRDQPRGREDQEDRLAGGRPRQRADGARTWRPATCWPRACRSSPAPMPPASCSARACRSSSPAAPTR